ncbi:MAG: hypothetical protein IJD59_01555 [Clostridia bacterium]|nr:hypothetical protein [Clostridia bacterium]
MYSWTVEDAGPYKINPNCINRQNCKQSCIVPISEKRSSRAVLTACGSFFLIIQDTALSGAVTVSVPACREML